ncbi:MAG TPA: SDR family oxidoreductase [Gemmatimonadaceae bacterium]|nr:SDR family oxidoreductase [Gemmatimonadaceae bacterium]
MSRFHQQPVVITGADRPGQVGAYLARRFAEEGAPVVLLARDAAAVEARAAELRHDGHHAIAHACDLSDPAAVVAVAARVSEGTAGRVAALVNAAGGFTADGPIADADPGILARMLAANLATAYHTTRAFLPLLRSARGAVVYVASAAAMPGADGAGMAAYAAAKSGVLAVMRAVAAEEAPYGVRANALAPTAIRTAANVASSGESASYVELHTVAEVVLWLCAQQGVTGQVVKLG